MAWPQVTTDDGHWSLNVVTAPTEEPVSLAEAKAHLRIDGTDEDALITALIEAATDWAEDFTGRAFVTIVFDLFLEGFPAKNDLITLPRPRLISVASVKYLDTDGVQQTLAASKYRVDIRSEPARISLAYGEEWPSTQPVSDAVEIRYTAGYGAAAAVPEQVKRAILMHVGHLFENRESVVALSPVIEVPKSTEHLLWPLRVWL